MQKYYSEMIKLTTYEERLEYLYIGDMVGRETFGNDRYLNQIFYKSDDWLRTRDRVIIRDNGCDLGVDGCELNKRNILVHHINPITKDDILTRNPKLFDLDNLISSSLQSHNYIHYGTKVDDTLVERTANDTCPWRKERG